MCAGHDVSCPYENQIRPLRVCGVRGRMFAGHGMPPRKAFRTAACLRCARAEWAQSEDMTNIFTFDGELAQVPVGVKKNRPRCGVVFSVFFGWIAAPVLAPVKFEFGVNSSVSCCFSHGLQMPRQLLD
jgi:hypothetical protein